jgi:hypothetical protein
MSASPGATTSSTSPGATLGLSPSTIAPPGSAPK